VNSGVSVYRLAVFATAHARVVVLCVFCAVREDDGFISVPEFERAMLSLSGHGEPQGSLPSEAQERVVAMLQDLAAWVDRDGDGKINYLEFISAFRVGTTGSKVQIASAPVPAVTDAINMLLEHLCSFFYRHRWSLRHAFEVRAAPFGQPLPCPFPVVAA
jgi:hypothetical protein